jgi:type IV pilus assembly protein PilC
MFLCVPVPIWLIGGVFVWFYVWLRFRKLRTRAILRTLSLIVGQNLPLVDGLRAAARAERGALRRILNDLANQMAAGDSLSTALCLAHGSCPGRVAGAIQAAERGGTLPTILQSLALDAEREQEHTHTRGPALVYSLLGLVVLVVGMLVVVFLVPQFRYIFADFGVTDLPAPTERIVSFANVVVSHPIILMFVILGAVTLVLQLVLGKHFLVRMPDRFQIAPTVIDTIAWRVPGLRRIAETRALARQLPILQASVSAGHDLPQAARYAFQVDANYWARRRLQRWADALERGEAPADAARRLGFPRPLRTALTAVHTPQDLGGRLAYLATYYRGLLVHWEQVAAGLLLPATVITWAACIGYIVVALYLPIRHLLDSIMDTVY